ncbi:hypothetical protein [Nannocystis radixulma]|uniref:AAA domain-containing protein n=1 Tax=Nannocystis radixulma TaxID=2995305 RepID=A0ABT5AZ81_9BACT|nr:hypothetical protein [Nannocystis radixulma]MDC0667141.1 hypothetical protein [Nannocystis radixulma]
MITDLKLFYRHLEGASLDDLGQTNIIVGPNNAGKTSLFRGIITLAREQAKANQAFVSIACTPDLPIRGGAWEFRNFGPLTTQAVPLLDIGPSNMKT